MDQPWPRHCTNRALEAPSPSSWGQDHKTESGHLRGLADKMLLAAADSKHSAANTPCSGHSSKPPLKCKFLKHHRSVTFSCSPQMLVVAQKRHFGERGELSAASVSTSPILGSLLLQ